MTLRSRQTFGLLCHTRAMACALYFSDTPPNMHGNHLTKGYDESLQQVHCQTTKGHPSKDLEDK